MIYAFSIVADAEMKNGLVKKKCTDTYKINQITDSQITLADIFKMILHPNK